MSIKNKTAAFLSNDALSEHVYRSLSETCDLVAVSFEPLDYAESALFGFGDIASVFDLLKKENVGRFVMVGRISPSLLFDGRVHSSGKAFLESGSPWKSEQLLKEAAGLLEKEGIEIVPVSSVLKKSLAEEKTYTELKPDKNQQADIEEGVKALKQIIPCRAGQSVAVKRGMIVAVEAVEGTDAMIERAGKYCSDFTLVKIAGPGKDGRFDLPAVGPGTVEAMKNSGGKVIAVEAGKTVIAEKEKTVAMCAQYGIILAGVNT